MGCLLEIAVQDLAGVLAAVDGGADRVELGSALSLGGVTPSAAMIEAAAGHGLPVHVLIRSREGNFEFTSDERQIMLADVRAALRYPVAGVVIGATSGGAVDRRFLAEVRELAPDVHLTFHRAFDTLADRPTGLTDLIELGIDRVLTSGGATNAPDALAELASLVALAAGRIEVMAGGGITAANVASVTACGVAAVHASAKTFVEEAMPIGLGALAGPGTSARAITDRQAVQALRAAIDAAG
jgi:copper homeostasis protein